MSKKGFSILSLISNLLVLSLLPIAISRAAAIAITEFRDEDGNVITKGNVGDEVTVIGTGATPLGRIRAYWDGWEDIDELATDPARPKGNATTGYEGDYKFNITIPEDVTGIHFIGVKDVMSEDIVSAAFTVEPKIRLDPKTGLKGDTITVNGTGFSAGSIITMTFNDTYFNVELVTTPTEVVTNDLGSFYGVTFRVPVDVYGDYKVYATDEAGNSAQAPFRVGPTVALTPEEGPTGTVVIIEGRGFEKRAGRDIWVTIDGVNATEVEDIETTLAGTFEGEIMIPTLPVGEYTVTAEQTTGILYSATADFEVTGTTSITLTPKAGRPGATVTIEGVNFTAIAGTKVEVKFETLLRATLTTNETGGFKGTFTVPALPTARYTVTARDENGLWNATAFRIFFAFLVLEPTEGPTGTNVTLTAYGLTNYYARANVTFDDTLVLLDEDTHDLTYGISFFYVPSVPVGAHTVMVEDEEGLYASATFTVSATTTLTIDPSSAPVATKVTMSGTGFSPHSVVEIILYNATWDAGILNDTAVVETDSDGNFEFEWNVTVGPDVLALGDYLINATDIERVFPPEDENLIFVHEVPFKVVAIGVTVETTDVAGDKKNEFRPENNVYIKGSGHTPSTTLDLYVVEDTTWSGGMNIPDRVSGTETSVATDEDGNIPVGTVAWNGPLTPGKYDIVIDANGNWIYDEDIDALDDEDVQVTAGFFVIPEYPLGGILGLVTSLAVLAVFKSKRVRVRL